MGNAEPCHGHFCVSIRSSDSPYRFSPAIGVALTVRKNTINRYYNKTDNSEVRRDYPDGDISRCSRAEIDDQNLRHPHPGRIFGSSKSDPSKIIFTPFSKDFTGNPGIIPVPAAKYFMNETSKVHAGMPFRNAQRQR